MAIARKKTASGKTRYFVVRKIGGKKVWLPGGHATLRAARDADAALTVDKSRGKDIAPKRERVAELLHEWQSAKSSAGKHRGRTSEEYARFVGTLPEDLTSKRLADVRPADVQRVVDSMVAEGLAPGTIERRYRILAAAFAYAVRTGRLVTNPGATVERPQVTRTRLRIPTGGQVGRILDASTGHPLHAALVLGAYSGLRRGKVLGFSWSDIDLDGGMLTVRRAATFRGREVIFDRPKTGNAERTLPLHPRAVEVLREHRRDQAIRRLAIEAGWRQSIPGGLVSDNGDGSPVHPDRLGMYFRRLTKRLGMEGVRLHDLRHAALSSAMWAGVAPLIVSRMAGHSRSTFNMDQYGHVAPSDALAAVEAIGEAVAC